MEAMQMEVQAFTRDGRAWKPLYLLSIDPETCIGCGRCFKVCGRDVMTLKGLTEDGNLVDLDDDEPLPDRGACVSARIATRVRGPTAP